MDKEKSDNTQVTKIRNKSGNNCYGYHRNKKKITKQYYEQFYGHKSNYLDEINS